MNTTFIISGGAGRVLTSVPALEKYEKTNPDDDFKILVHNWDQLFWGHPTLQNRVFLANLKGNFDHFIKNNKTVIPEPYQLHSYYNQETNLVEAFDEIINNTNNHDDLNLNSIHLSEIELEKSKEMVEKFKSEKKKQKVVLFQPYGSSVEIVNNKPIDSSNRSLKVEHYLSIVKELSKEAVIIYCSQPELKHPQDNFSVSFSESELPYFRHLAGLIQHSDYFIGCDSVGQHFARALNKPGLVLMGGTDERNTSYPNHFKIYRKKDRKVNFAPIRLSDIDSEFTNKLNDRIMNFTDTEINEIMSIIKHDLFLPKSLRESNNVFSEKSDCEQNMMYK